jgi:hypothetical protein
MLSLDSGGNFHGCIGDLARMAVLGEPDAELQENLHEIESIQACRFLSCQTGSQKGQEGSEEVVTFGRLYAGRAFLDRARRSGNPSNRIL